MQDELTHISTPLSKNNYPGYLIQRQLCHRSQNTTSKNQEYTSTVVLPYVKCVSEAIRRVLLEVDIRVVFRPHTTLRQFLVLHEDAIDLEKKANVIYQIPCSLCSASYIGQTSRTLDTRLKECKRAMKKGDTSTYAVAEHVWLQGHQMDFQNSTILAQETDHHQRCYMESWLIQCNNTINRELGSLPSVYKCLFSTFCCFWASLSEPNLVCWTLRGAGIYMYRTSVWSREGPLLGYTTSTFRIFCDYAITI